MIRALFAIATRMSFVSISVTGSIILCSCVAFPQGTVSPTGHDQDMTASGDALAAVSRTRPVLQEDVFPVLPKPIVPLATRTPPAIFDTGASNNHLWTRKIDIAHEPPVLSKGTVFIVSREGVLYALKSQTGDTVWQLDLKTYLRPSKENATKDSGVDRGQSHSSMVKVSGVQPAPTVAGRYVFVSVSNRRDGHVLAVNRTNGAVLWHHVSLGSASSPTRGAITASLSTDDQRVVVRTQDGLTALSIDTGKELWNVSIDPANVPISPSNSQPVLAEGFVYVGADSGVAYAFEASNGHKRWQFSTDAFRQQQKGLVAELNIVPSRCTPLLAGDTLMIATGTGYIYGVDAQKGVPRWRRQVGEVWQLTQTDRCVYACTATGLFELDRKTGALLRSLPLEGGAFSCVVSPSHILIVRNVTKYSGWEFLDLATWQTVPCPVKFLADMGVAANSGGVIAAGRAPDAPWRGPRLLSAYSAKPQVTAKPPITARPPAKRRSR